MSVPSAPRPHAHTSLGAPNSTLRSRIPQPTSPARPQRSPSRTDNVLGIDLARPRSASPRPAPLSRMSPPARNRESLVASEDSHGQTVFLNVSSYILLLSVADLWFSAGAASDVQSLSAAHSSRSSFFARRPALLSSAPAYISATSFALSPPPARVHGHPELELHRLVHLPRLELVTDRPRLSALAVNSFGPLVDRPSADPGLCRGRRRRILPSPSPRS